MAHIFIIRRRAASLLDTRTLAEPADCDLAGPRIGSCSLRPNEARFARFLFLPPRTRRAQTKTLCAAVFPLSVQGYQVRRTTLMVELCFPQSNCAGGAALYAVTQARHGNFYDTTEAGGTSVGALFPVDARVIHDACCAPSSCTTVSADSATA